MNPTDDDIRSMLTARADRANTGGTHAQTTLAGARELAAAEPRGAHGWGRLPLAMPRVVAGAASVFAALLVVALVALPLANRAPASAAPTVASAVTGPSFETTSPNPETPYHPGGIPISIDGEPVLVGLDTQRRLAEATDDTPFLAGGFSWYGPIICSGGIGLSDPNPLGARGCPTHDIAGLPGELFVPSGRIEIGDVPLVARVHTNDPGAESCLPHTIDRCRERVVLDAIVWQGDDATRSSPLGPREAIGRVLNIAFADRRVAADGATYYVDEPRFVMPISCTAPWPALVYAVRGDPRLGLLAIFRDEATRASFQAATARSASASCLDSPIDRPSPPHWIGQDNILVLAFADDATASEFAAQLDWKDGALRNTISLPDPSIDRSLETLIDYLDSRAAGPNVEGDAPRLTFGPTPAYAHGTPAIDVDAGWSADVMRRYEADALDGVVELVTDAPTTTQLGDAGLFVHQSDATRVWVYRVTYPGATDARLAEETFAIFQVPDSTSRDWYIVRVDGEPFPIVRIPVPADLPFPSGLVDAIIPSDSGDVPCLPPGQECQ
jgi:hypothetical protein